jgi:hypothetical protein
MEALVVEAMRELQEGTSEECRAIKTRVEKLESNNERKGADVAELFDVITEGATPAVPGMAVSIDPSNAGKLLISTNAFDRKVAGIISGAGGIQPGLVLGQEGTLAYGDYPVAVCGRVYAKADASFGPIKPGDLLTTSTTPGHLRVVDDMANALGAVVGKALSGLNSGKGEILVLVTLQ